MPTIGGANSLDVLTPRINIINYAVAGFAFNDATMAGNLGIRKVGQCDLPPIVRNDAIGKDQTDAQDVKFTVEMWQDDYVAVKRQMILSQVLQQIQFQIGIDWYNFIDNEAQPPFVTPSGSVLLGCETTFEATPTELSLKAEYTGKMHPKEYDWLLANAASAAAGGGTGGTSITGLTQQVYDQSEYGFPGINKVYFGTGDISTDDEIGLLEAGSKISIKFAKTAMTTRNQPIVRMCEVSNEIVMLQGRYFDAQAIANLRNSDKFITIQLWNGIQLCFDSSVSMTGNPQFEDGKAYIKISQKGKIPFDVLNGAQSNILFDDVNSKITFNRIGY